MPIYEYRCKNCHKTFSAIVRPGRPSPVCKHCGSGSLEKLISTFAVVKGTNTFLEDEFDEAQRKMQGVDENDPRSMAKLARKMQAESGENLGPEFDTMVEQMESGEMPSEPSDTPAHE